MNKKKAIGPAIKAFNWLLCFFIAGCATIFGQQTHTISGTITDKSNGETLFGASLFLKGTTIGGTTNEYGFYSITAPEGEYVLNISYIGYTDVNININLNQDIRQDIEISMEAAQLDEVVGHCRGDRTGYLAQTGDERSKTQRRHHKTDPRGFG